MAREFLEHFYFRGADGVVEGSGGSGTGGYCGGPTGATTPDEDDTYNNNGFQNNLTRSLEPVTTGSNVNNNTSSDMVDAVKKKWVRLQANIDNMFQGFGFSQPFNRRREGAVVAGGGEGRCGVGGNLTPSKKRNENLQLHHSNNHRHHRHWAEHDTHPNSANSDAVVVYQEQIEMALLSQGELRLGVGHDFVLEFRSNPTWCDKCGDFIWGAYKQCLKCKHCQYTCHKTCRQLVTLDCANNLPNSTSDGSIETSLSEPASTPSSNSIVSDALSNGCSREFSVVYNEDIPLRIDIHEPVLSPFLWVTKSLRDQEQLPLKVKDTVACWDWEKLQLLFRDKQSKFPPIKFQDETDSGYRSGPISDEILPKKEPSEATLNREELKSKLQEYNNNVPNANLALDNKYTKKSSDVDSECSRVSSDFGLEHSGESAQSEPSRYITSNEENSCTAEAHPESDSDFYEDESINLASKESDGETFQGFIKVTLNLIRPITMSLGARPPSIYEVLTREHIVEQNTQSISFYMPRDTVKSIHVDSETTTKEVIAALLKKFKILDNPRKFAMYEQEFKNKKLVRLRRVMPEEFPLQVCLGWETSKLESYRLVLQENEASGDIDWSNFSNPELNNFVKVLDREESEHIQQLQYKYHMMKKAVERRMKELRAAQQEAKHSQ